MFRKTATLLLSPALSGPTLAHPGDHAPMSAEGYLAHVAALPFHLAAPLGALTLIALFFGARTLPRQRVGRRKD